jgi:acyl-CoA thioester hydrolase
MVAPAAAPTRNPFASFPMPSEFVHRRLVEFAETDMAGIVHFAHFFRWMESAEHAFLRSLGFSVHHHAPEGTSGWPRVKVECSYHSPLRFEQEVEVVLRVAEVRNRSVRYAFEIRPAGGQPAATGTVAAVYARVDAQSGGLCAAPIPEELRELLKQWEKGEAQGQG